MHRRIFPLASPDEVTAALEKLEAEGLVEGTPDGRWRTRPSRGTVPPRKEEEGLLFDPGPRRTLRGFGRED
jgi:hypothetical protein